MFPNIGQDPPYKEPDINVKTTLATALVIVAILSEIPLTNCKFVVILFNSRDISVSGEPKDYSEDEHHIAEGLSTSEVT